MWTQFAELDEVLEAFVDGVRSVLGGNLVGIYLQGSFALGDASHCNTAVVRWSLREHGIVLVGPEPEELVDPRTKGHPRRRRALGATRL